MKLILALAIAGLTVSPIAAKAPVCRDAKGHFIKCSTPGSVPGNPAAVLAGSPAATTVDKSGKCHIATGPKKGQFTACPKK